MKGSTAKLLTPILGIALIGCSNPAARPVSNVVFVDASVSPGDQSKLWLGALRNRVCKSLGRGDSVEVLVIGAATGERAPVYEAAIPAPPRGMRGDLLVRSAVEQACKGSEQAVRSSLSAASERQTRLLDSIPRIPRVSARSLHVLYLSDAMEASPELNLERTALDEAAAADLAHRVVQARGWPPGLLRGAVIDFVLDSPAPNTRPHLNGRAHVERFWRCLFESIGADLRSFDSRVSLLVRGPQ